MSASLPYVVAGFDVHNRRDRPSKTLGTHRLFSCVQCSNNLIHGGGGGVGRETRPGTENQCSNNLQSDPLISGF